MAAERAARSKPGDKLDNAAVAALNGAHEAASPTGGHRSHGSASTLTATESPAASTAPSPHLSAYRPPSHPASDAGSISSERTAVPYRVASPSPPPHHPSQPVRPSPLHIEQQSSPSSPKAHASPALSLHSAHLGSETSSNGNSARHPHHAPLTPSVIQSPQKANALEARWIEHIGASFADAEVAELWPVLLRYLDGRHALDEVALREGIKRKRLAGVVGKLRELGVLLIVRHW